MSPHIKIRRESHDVNGDVQARELDPQAGDIPAAVGPELPMHMILDEDFSCLDMTDEALRVLLALAVRLHVDGCWMLDYPLETATAKHRELWSRVACAYA